MAENTDYPAFHLNDSDESWLYALAQADPIWASIIWIEGEEAGAVYAAAHALDILALDRMYLVAAGYPFFSSDEGGEG